MATEPTVDKRSVFPFFDGDRLLVLTAPDHPNFPSDELNDYNFWDIMIQARDGELLATRGSHKDADARSLWYEVSSALYQSVSSNETDRRTPEIKAWLEQVVAAYRARISDAQA